MVTFWRNWSHLAFQSQQPFDNVCMSWFNTVLTCSRTVFPGLCKHNTSQSRTKPLCLMRALLVHSDWITPIISEHNHVLYRFYSFTWLTAAGAHSAHLKVTTEIIWFVTEPNGTVMKERIWATSLINIFAVLVLTHTYQWKFWHYSS